MLICPAPRPAATTASHASSTISSTLRVVRNHCGSSVPLLSDWLRASISLFSGAWQWQYQSSKIYRVMKNWLEYNSRLAKTACETAAKVDAHVKWLVERRVITDNVDQWRAVLSCIV